MYSVNGKNGENLDTKRNKKPVENTLFSNNYDPQANADTVKETTPSNDATPDGSEGKSLFQQVEALKQELNSLPKHRGPKTKQEKEIIDRINSLQKQIDIAAENVNEKAKEEEKNDSNAVNSNSANNEMVPEEAFASERANTENAAQDNSILTKLQEKANEHNKQQDNTENAEDKVWEGDPGDGTDFIPIVDLPIEDQGMTPTYDMFDNPTTPYNDYSPPIMQKTKNSKKPTLPTTSMISFLPMACWKSCRTAMDSYARATITIFLHQTTSMSLSTKSNTMV